MFQIDYSLLTFNIIAKKKNWLIAIEKTVELITAIVNLKNLSIWVQNKMKYTLKIIAINTEFAMDWTALQEFSIVVKALL